MEPEKIYKSLIENSSLEPPPDIWDGIENQLDIDMVWSGIDSALPKTSANIWRRSLSIAATLLIIVSAGAILLKMGGKSETEMIISAMPESEIADPHPELPIMEIIERREAESVIYSQVVRVADDTEYGISDTEKDMEAGKEEIRVIYPASAPVSEMPRLAAALTDRDRDVLREFTLPSTPSYMGDADGKKGERSRSLYLGVTGQLANTWMINHKTIEALKRDDFTAVNASYGRNIGFHAGTAIGERMGLRSDFMWLSQSRQSYNEYINGKYVTSYYELNYYTVSLQAGYNFNLEGRQHYAWVGSYVGFIRGANRALPGITFDIRDEYRDLDFGVMAGYDYPFSPGYGLTITPGVSLKYGLTNVFRGNNYIPYYLGQTRNAAINFSLSVSYNIF